MTHGSVSLKGDIYLQRLFFFSLQTRQNLLALNAAWHELAKSSNCLHWQAATRGCFMPKQLIIKIVLFFPCRLTYQLKASCLMHLTFWVSNKSEPCSVSWQCKNVTMFTCFSRWPKLASFTRLQRTARTSPCVSSASKSWRAGSLRMIQSKITTLLGSCVRKTRDLCSFLSHQFNFISFSAQRDLGWCRKVMWFSRLKIKLHY